MIYTNVLNRLGLAVNNPFDINRTADICKTSGPAPRFIARSLIADTSEATPMSLMTKAERDRSITCTAV
jgi:hypothetical protein